jgi:TetR/AcrR family transcriptional regulator, fatty acid metabolism regulator protein
MDTLGLDLETEEKQPTRRKIQADATRKRIYEIAIALMEKKGFANTTIVEISKKAGVSVGTFYNYFSSKEEIFYDIFKKADEYFERTVSRSLRNLSGSASDQVVLFFRYYARYDVRRGFHNINQLYGTKTKFFAVKGRYMQELLKGIIAAGQESGELGRDMTPDEITEYMFVTCRGIVYDWCIHEASYNLETRVVEYMSKLVGIFKAAQGTAGR